MNDDQSKSRQAVASRARDVPRGERGNGRTSVESEPEKPVEEALYSRPRAAAAHLKRVEKVARDTYLGSRAALAASTFRALPSIMIIPMRVAPDTLVENRPAWVEFYLWNLKAAKVVNAFVRVRVEPRHSIDDYPGLFEFPVRELALSQTIFGAVSFTLPRADLGNKLTLELCQWGEIPAGGEFAPLNVLATAEIEFDVAARFSVSWNSIHIRDTASIDDDTLFVSFTGGVGDRTWNDTAQLGDHDNTGRGGISPQVLAVGPFDILPGSGSGVAFSCVIANAGHTSEEEDAKKALLVVSHVGAVTATVIMSIIFPIGAAVWAALSEGADQLHQAIINWALADCDTVVMNEGRLITEQELFLATFDPMDQKAEAHLAAWIIHTVKKAGQVIADWLGGGCRDSDYTAGISVMRHRIPEMIHTIGVDGAQLSPDQRAGFGLVGAGLIVQYDVEGAGKVSVDGVYEAPEDVSERKFDIVKWTVSTETKRGIEPLYSDFAVVVLD
jgi:hypothetical protein